MHPEEADIYGQLYFEKEQSCEAEEGIFDLQWLLYLYWHERQVAKV